MVNAQDFTYSKGYLGLLSTLGASLEIIFCCAPAVHKVYQQWRQASQKRLSSLAVQTPIEISFPMREESIDLPNLRFSAWLKSGSSGVPSTQRQPLRPHVGSAPLTEDSATQYCGRGTRWSMDGCVAGVKAPPCGGLRRHRTF